MAHKIFIAGAGGIGRAAGLILTETAVADYQVTLGDQSEAALSEAASWIDGGNTRSKAVATFAMADNEHAMASLLRECDVLLDCLPGRLAPQMARLAKDNHCHYANLTEYVKETKEIMDLAEGAETAFVLQTGLAPGFINVLAVQLYHRFVDLHAVEHVDSIQMKVGALSQHAVAPHFYAFTWSPVGVATEYVEDAEVIRDGHTTRLPALSGLETLVIDGITYEEDFTSGGAADMPSSYVGKARNLDYKTLRYPGHYPWVAQQVKGIAHGEDTKKRLEEIMLDKRPCVEDDVVIIYSSVVGRDKQGVLQKVEKSYSIKPMKIGHRTLRAIQSTTAAPLCEMAHMMIRDSRQGLVLQSDIDYEAFMKGHFVQMVYGD